MSRMSRSVSAVKTSETKYAGKISTVLYCYVLAGARGLAIDARTARPPAVIGSTLGPKFRIQSLPKVTEIEQNGKKKYHLFT